MQAINIYSGPYDTEKQGFYFSNLEQYERQAQQSLAEEFWFEWIAGHELLANIFRFYQISQVDLPLFFEQVVNAELTTEQLLALQYLAEWGRANTLAEGLEQLPNVQVHQCSLQDFVDELIAATFFDVFQLFREEPGKRYLDREDLFWRLLDRERCEEEMLLDRPDVESYQYDGRPYVVEWAE